MRFNDTNYNRIHALDMHDWNDEWIIDKYGDLVLSEEYFNDEITTETIKPEMGD
jgi:hypothetical protein